MATIAYRIKDTKKNPTVIYARFRHGKEHDYEITTDFYVEKSRWSKKKGIIIRATETAEYVDQINTKLREFENHILNEFNLSQIKDDKLNKAWFEQCYQDFFNKPKLKAQIDKSIYFTDFAEWYIEMAKEELNPRTSKKRSKKTIQDYNTTLKKLRHFEEVKKLKYKHSEINKDFHRDFINYCIEYHANNMKTIGGEIDNIRLFLKRADAEEYKVSKDYKLGYLFSPDNDTYDIAFSTEDIDKIVSYDFSDNDRLDNARDWLVIGIWTGLRISDLLKLTPNKLNDGFFELENKKTGIFVVIPIHKDVQAILDKRDGFPRKISDQKFNDYIKEVSKDIGLTEIIDGAKKVETKIKGYGDKPAKAYRKKIGLYPKFELVTSHIGRRTFATIHYGKLDTLTIMNITGHKTEKQFLEYVKITPRIHAEKMKEFWNKINKN